jgi:hypothetical protein
VSDNPYTSPEQVGGTPFSKPAAEGGLDFSSVASLCQTAGWLKFLGILNIIAGVLYCLTIIGLIIGWLPIWIGISLNKASDSLKSGYARRDPSAIRAGMDSLSLVIKIFGVLAVIGLAINVVYFAVIILAVIGGAVSSQM